MFYDWIHCNHLIFWRLLWTKPLLDHHILIPSLCLSISTSQYSHPILLKIWMSFGFLSLLHYYLISMAGRYILQIFSGEFLILLLLLLVLYCRTTHGNILLWTYIYSLQILISPFCYLLTVAHCFKNLEFLIFKNQ